MTTPTTSPAKGAIADATAALQDRPRAPAGTLAEWSRFGSFLIRPALPDSLADLREGARGVLRMLGLDMIVMIGLLSALGVASALGLELPENINNSLGFTVGAVLLVVVGAPLAEELIFRSWLNGHPAVIAVVAICALGLGLWPFAVTKLYPEGGMNLVVAIGPLIALVAAPLSAYLLLKHPVPRLFTSGFPVFFWLSSVGFALVHFVNYTEGALLIILPLLLPQLALGTMLGYLRVQYGLVHAIALHALHNGILFGLAMAGKYAAESMPAPA